MLQNPRQVIPMDNPPDQGFFGIQVFVFVWGHEYGLFDEKAIRVYQWQVYQVIHRILLNQRTTALTQKCVALLSLNHPSETPMTLNTLLTQLATAPEQIRFADVLATIAANYTYTPQTFTNGSGDDTVTNPAGTNEGSCKLFAFAHLQDLSAAQTLACFGEHYRDVLATPADTNHANIRTFMRHGWAGIHFNGNALQANP